MHRFFYISAPFYKEHITKWDLGKNTASPLFFLKYDTVNPVRYNNVNIDEENRWFQSAFMDGTNFLFNSATHYLINSAIFCCILTNYREDRVNCFKRITKKY